MLLMCRAWFIRGGQAVLKVYVKKRAGKVSFCGEQGSTFCFETCVCSPYSSPEEPPPAVGSVPKRLSLAEASRPMGLSRDAVLWRQPQPVSVVSKTVCEELRRVVQLDKRAPPKHLASQCLQSHRALCKEFGETWRRVPVICSDRHLECHL